MLNYQRVCFFVCQVPELSDPLANWVARSPFFSHVVRPRMVSGDVSATAAAETVAQLFVLQQLGPINGGFFNGRII